MPKKARRKTQPIHESIKKALGYPAAEPDAAVLKDWNARKRRVCKPCWELKYCPYGPLVEQSPILPPEREGMIEQNAYFRNCLKTGMVGSVTKLTDEDRTRYENWLTDDQLILHQALTQMRNQLELEAASGQKTDAEQIEAWLGSELPPIHIYRTSFDIDGDSEIEEKDFSASEWKAIQDAAEKIKSKYREALNTGTIDHRHPLEPARRAWFKSRIDAFDPHDYPAMVPQTFSEGSCNVFGHICPVFFAAEALTETGKCDALGAAVFHSPR